MRPNSPAGLLVRRVVPAFGAAVLLAAALPGGGSGRDLHLIRVGAGGTRFDPDVIPARPGDTLRFVNRGGFHNVQFEADSIADPALGLLAAAMPGEKIAPLGGPLLLEPDERYDIVLPARLPPGRYPFMCLPHAAGGMRGVLIVLP